MDARVGTRQGLIALEASVAAPNYAPLPVVLERGEGSWLWDADGRRYLDFMSAYSAVSHGHAHPRLVQALIEQAQQVAVTSRAYHSTTLGPFLQALVDAADLEAPSRALPASGGCESVETAIKAVRRWGYRVKGIPADRAQIVVARGNFHGRSSTVVSFSTEPSYREDFGPFTPGFRHFDFGDIESLKRSIDECTCAVLIEPIQGEAGIVVPPDGFLATVRRLCNERGVLLIFDEIQSGLGRTGAMFAYMHEGVRPDGVIIGKALGGGLLPVSAFVARAEILDLMGPGSHGSTFGGSPLAARVGLEALRVLQARAVQPTAFFCAHDGLAVTVVSELLRIGCRIPEDVSVIGFGDFSSATQIAPQLTTVRMHGAEIGAAAVRLLDNRVHARIPPEVPIRVQIACRIVERSSCGPAMRQIPSNRAGAASRA